MRVVVDVSPLSHPRTGIGNYIRARSQAWPRPRRDGTRSTLSRRRASAARRRSGPRCRESTCRCESSRSPPRTPSARRGAARAARPSSGSREGSTRSCSASGCTRHNGPACGRPCSTIWCRSVIPSGARRARSRCTRARRGTPLGPATSSSRTPARRPPTSPSSSGSGPTASSTRRPGSRRASVPTATRRPRWAGDPRPRDDRAAQEPRAPGRGLAPPRPGARPRAGRGRGMGRPARPRGSPDPAARLRLGRRRGPSLPWSRGARVSGALRGVRHADRRGDGVRHAGRRLVAPTLDEACGDAAVRVDPLDVEAIAAGIREAVARRAELVPRGLEHAARFSWERTGETMLRALEGGRDTASNSLLLAASPDAVAARMATAARRACGDRRSPSRRGRRRRPAARGPRPRVPRPPPLAGEARLLAPRRGRRGVGRDARRGRRARAHRGDRIGGRACCTRRAPFRTSSPATRSPFAERFPVGTERITVWPFVADAPPAWEPTLDEEHVEHRWLDADGAVALLHYPEPREALRRAAS